jgi:hypothetical protein
MTTRSEWLLIALAHRNGEPMTPAQIQKAMFLMSAEAQGVVGPRFYQFIPYNYGPFDASVCHDLDSLIENGLVSSANLPGRDWKLYAVTPAGLEAAERSRGAADARGVRYLQKVVDWVSSRSFPQLVRAIYNRYPQYRTNSVFVG